MTTWLADFTERTDLNKYPIALRTEGGIGFRLPDGSVESSFVGHPVHYESNREWKPITLDYIPSTGEFDGSWFGWDGEAITYCGYVLFKPQSITFNGIARNLKFLRLDNKLISDVAGVGTFEIVITESGCRQILTIPDPIEGELSFQVSQTAGWEKYLYINERRIVGTDVVGEVYQLTTDMTYPIVIDPDYSGTTGDGYVTGTNATYATARSTSTAYDIAATTIWVGQVTGYDVHRSFIKMDTSGIPDTDTVSQVNLKLVCTTDNSTVADFDVVIRKHDWSGQDPLAAGTREAAYDGCLSASSDNNIWRNTSGMSINTQYTSGNLDTARVSKTGYTYYSLISSRDISSTVGGGNEYIRIASQDHGTSGYRPVLTVVHAAGGWANITKVNGVVSASVSKVNNVAVASISKINGVAV